MLSNIKIKLTKLIKINPKSLKTIYYKLNKYKSICLCFYLNHSEKFEIPMIKSSAD